MMYFYAFIIILRFHFQQVILFIYNNSLQQELAQQAIREVQKL